MRTEHTECLSDASAFLPDDQACHIILDNTPQSYVLVNTDFDIVYFNRAAKERVSVFLQSVLHPGMNFLHLVADNRKEEIKNTLDRVLQGQQQFVDIQYNRPDGTVVYFQNHFQPAFNKERIIIGAIITSTDISGWKKAELALRESEERLQFALEAAAQGAWDWNLQTNKVVYSDSYKKLYGFEEGDLNNDVSEWMTRIHPEDQAKMQSSVAEHLQAAYPEYDSRYRIRAKNGSYRWVMARGRLISFDDEGQPLRMIGTHTDITEAVEREQALKEMNERFDCVMKATHELLWELDIPNNRVLRAKESVARVYGIADDSQIRTLDQWLQRVHPEDRSALEAAINQILEAPHQQTFESEYRFLRDDGEYAFIYDRYILLRDENDRPIRLIGSAQDISERKRLEKQLLKAELEYQRRINQASVDSQEKERAEIGKELHDNVNQVLTTTKLYLDLAVTETALREDLIQRSLHKINKVIQEIRHLSRSLMDPTIGDLGLLASINDLVENIYLTKNLHVQVSTDETIEGILTASQKLALFRIIQESLNNVLRHACATTAVLTISVQGNILRLIIKDDGIGFDPETLKKGAGLKNIQNRIYLIHGTLQLKSIPGKGCTIELQFPIKTDN